MMKIVYVSNIAKALLVFAVITFGSLQIWGGDAIAPEFVIVTDSEAELIKGGCTYLGFNNLLVTCINETAVCTGFYQTKFKLVGGLYGTEVTADCHGAGGVICGTKHGIRQDCGGSGGSPGGNGHFQPAG